MHQGQLIAVLGWDSQQAVKHHVTIRTDANVHASRSLVFALPQENDQLHHPIMVPPLPKAQNLQ